MFDSDFIKSLLENIGGNSATLVLDSNGICIFANSQSLNVLGIHSRELIGCKFVDVVELRTLEGKDVESHKNPVTKLLTVKGFTQTTPFFYQSPQNTEDTFALTTIPIKKGKQINFIVVQIRRTMREVEVGEMKSLFVSFAAHQLKTPSSVVKGFLELMIRQGEAAYSKDQWNFLTSAFESNENLIAVSKALLNMARLEGGLIEPDLRIFNPYKSMQSKIESFYEIYSLKEIEIVLDHPKEQRLGNNGEDLHLHSDENFFIEVFGILLGNAIKHSPSGSKVNVICKLNKDFCEVSVIDYGPGIAKSVQEKLFKHGQDTTSDENSHGLGLYMAKKYISLLSGEIGLVNQSTAGSNFYFKVPNVKQR